jgi:hypothetical protein
MFNRLARLRMSSGVRFMRSAIDRACILFCANDRKSSSSVGVYFGGGTVGFDHLVCAFISISTRRRMPHDRFTFSQEPPDDFRSQSNTLPAYSRMEVGAEEIILSEEDQASALAMASTVLGASNS